MQISQGTKLIKNRFFILILTQLILYISALYLIYCKLIIVATIFFTILFILGLFTIISFQKTIKKLQEENELIKKEKHDIEVKLEGQILDVTASNNELKILNLELIKAKNKVEELSHYRSTFISNMSHELKTPLNAIIGFTHVLLESEFIISEDEKINLIKTIHNAGEELLNIINNILDLSDLKQDIDIYEPVPRYIDITPIIDALVSTAKGLLKDKSSILLNTKIGKNYPNVYADGKALGKVLTHIIDNASKYTKKGEIFIYTEEDEDYLYICISDTGVGMTESELERIFEPFTKMIINEQPISISGSVGIGMPISKYLMEKMSGNLLVQSKKDYGTTVKIALKKEPKYG